MIQRLTLVALVVCVPVFVGCGGGGPSGPPTTKISGTVMKGPNPMPNIKLLFTLEGDGFTAEGTTNEEGQYTIEAVGIGKNKVVLAQGFGDLGDPALDAGQAQAAGDPGATGGLGPEGGEGGGEGAAPGIPKELQSPDTTTLEFDIPAGGRDDVNIDL